jgi:hypothetical protein
MVFTCRYISDQFLVVSLKYRQIRIVGLFLTFPRTFWIKYNYWLIKIMPAS